MVSLMSRFRVFVGFLLFILFSPCCLGQETETQQPGGKLSVEELEQLTDQELELICVERGFELIRDGSEGELTHADYVEAARRCLAIEEDMNEILEQNPELAEELLSELDRMKEEKVRLEQEVEKQEAERARLEQEVQDTTSSSNEQEDPASTATKQQPRMWGDQTAYSQYQRQQQQQQSSSDSSGSSTQHSTEDSAIHNDDDMCENPTTQVDGEERDKATDFSLKGFLQEVIAEFEKDARRFTTLILPVVRPIFSAGNFAWRYLKILAKGAREQYKKYKESGDNNNKKETPPQSTAAATAATK